MSVWVGGKDEKLEKQILKMLHVVPKTLPHQECIFKTRKVPTAILVVVKEKFSLAKEKQVNPT